MELLVNNYVNTTTQYTVPESTATVENLLRRDTSFQWTTDTYGNDLTTASITITFDQTLNVSRILLAGMNLKGFTMYYNGATANTFSLTTTAGTLHTSASDFSSNSETSMYMRCATAAVSSITIDMKSTQVADAQKAMGYIAVSNIQHEFTRVPAAKGYKPKIVPKQVVHGLSDGGTRLQTIDQKWDFALKFTNMTIAERDSLKTVYDLRSTWLFIPEGTATSWDGVFSAVVWPGAFELYRYANNNRAAGVRGNIRFKEIPT